MDKARYLAVKCLLKIEKNGYSNLVLKEQLSDVTDRRDAAFCTAIVYGVISRRVTLEYILNKYLKTKLVRLDSEIRAILLSGAYQVLFMERVPDFAAVNESVGLTTVFKKKSAGALVNAVLRAVKRFDFSEFDLISDLAERYALKYSTGRFVAEMLIAQYGEKTAELILESTLAPQNTYIYTNPLKPSGELTELTERCELRPTFVENIFEYNDGSVAQSNLFKNGNISILGLWSAAAAAALEPQKGHKVVDACAAPGGKSVYLAGMMKNSGKIYSCDINKSRLSLIAEAAARLNAVIIEPVLADATVFSQEFIGADRVLCDVPCSGIGVMASKPELRYREESGMEELCLLQRRILENCSKYVKSGGRLVYSTCTINRAENEGNIDWFLSTHKDFHAVTPSVFNDRSETDINYVLNLPIMGGQQGFFVATLERM